MKQIPMIGVTNALLRENPKRIIFNGRPLCVLEESLGHFLQRAGTLPVMIPTGEDLKSMSRYAQHISALVIHGGEDIAPETYGDKPRHKDWAGNLKKDRMEIELIKACLEADIPIFGICRGAQLLNVALGGTLHQDIRSQFPHALVHRDAQLYEKNQHEIEIQDKGLLAQIYPESKVARVNSVHHQSIDVLGRDLRIEAISKDDGIIEAISLDSVKSSGPLCFGVQWHPEFQDVHDATLLDPLPLLLAFINSIAPS